MRVYTARWLLPVSAPPVRDGAVAVDAEGRVAYAGPAALAPPGDVTPLGEAALLPGLVAMLPDGSPPAAGVTAAATTTARDALSLIATGRRGVSYLPPGAPAPRATPRVRLGRVTPAVYAIDEDALLDLCARAVGDDLPLAAPAGATAAEVAFLREASGPHADALRARGAEVVRRAHSTVHLLAELGVAAVARPLLVGGAFFDESDVALAAYYGCPVAYAPPADGAPTLPDPLAALLDAGVRVALAAPDPLAAALALGTPPDAALHLATLGAARALGLDAEAGSLEPGKWADLCAFLLAPAESQLAETSGPAHAVAAAAHRGPSLALVRGAELRPA